MATKLKEVDAVMIGMGWTGAIMAREFTKAGLNVVGLERGADRLQCARPVQRSEVGCRTAEKRGECEDRQPDKQHAPPPKTVGQGARRHQQCCERKDIGADHPFDIGESAAQVARNGRQRDRDNVGVEHDEEGRAGTTKQHAQLPARKPSRRRR